MKYAVVDAGGGLRGAYAAGIFDYMMDNAMTFDLGIGVSAGSANVGSFLAGQRGRNYWFYTRYPFRREYMSLHNMLTRHSYLDLDYVYGTLSAADGENPFDYARFRDNPTAFLAVATDAETGEARYFGKEYVTAEDMSVFKASSAIPFVSRPHAVGGVSCFDGALSDPIPVQKALDMGCDRVVLVLTRPLDTLRTSETDVRLANRIRRRYPLAAQGLCRRAERYNDAVARARALAEEGRVLILAPDDTLGVSTLTRDRSALRRLYAKGYRDAERTDFRGFVRPQ